MGRLPRFKDHRFVGTRDDMRVYDCDDPEQFTLLETVAAHDDNGIQTFGPDTAAEARNRGFRPVRSVGSG
jgi:hypothetical protein